jgi:hypothetical protein
MTRRAIIVILLSLNLLAVVGGERAGRYDAPPLRQGLCKNDLEYILFWSVVYSTLTYEFRLPFGSAEMLQFF